MSLLYHTGEFFYNIAWYAGKQLYKVGKWFFESEQVEVKHNQEINDKLLSLIEKQEQMMEKQLEIISHLSDGYVLEHAPEHSQEHNIEKPKELNIVNVNHI